MQLHIRHETVYRYGEPVKRSVQNLRLTPRRDPVQRALSWTISAPGRQHEQIDAYGNVVHLLTLDEPHREIRIVVQGVVETMDADAGPLPNDGKLSPLTYLAETSLTRPDAAIQSFATGNMPRSGDRRAALMKLAEAVGEAVHYERGATDVHASAVNAFSRGKGVCQDHTHIFLSAARTLGIPARYVTGYLLAGGEEHAPAHHAWAEAWTEGLGWVGFDPTNRACATEAYIRTATGLDYAEASPIRGVRSGGGTETMRVLVRFPGQQQQNQ